jgi:hypothetical protein
MFSRILLWPKYIDTKNVTVKISGEFKTIVYTILTPIKIAVQMGFTSPNRQHLRRFYHSRFDKYEDKFCSRKRIVPNRLYWTVTNLEKYYVQDNIKYENVTVKISGEFKTIVYTILTPIKIAVQMGFTSPNLQPRNKRIVPNRLYWTVTNLEKYYVQDNIKYEGC